MKLKETVFEEYLLITVFVAVSFLSLVFTGYMTATYDAEKMSQGYYGANTVYLQVNDPEEQLDYETLYNGIKDTIIYRELSGDRIRGLFLRGNVESPPLMNGRFFTEDDFFNGKKLLVAGKAYDPVIQKHNGRDYIEINQEYYEVIGRLGTGEISTLDNMLLINLDAVELGKSGIYAIDGKSNKKISASVRHLKSEVVNSGASCAVIERESTSIKRLLKYEQSNTLLYIVLLLVLLLSSVAVNLSLYEKKKSEIAVKRLLGFSSAQIIGQMLKHYALLAHIGYIAGLLAALLLIYIGIIRLSAPLLAAASYPVAMLFGLLLITLPVVQALHSPARELLNE